METAVCCDLCLVHVQILVWGPHDGGVGRLVRHVQEQRPRGVMILYQGLGSPGNSGLSLILYLISLVLTWTPGQGRTLPSPHRTAPRSGASRNPPKNTF